MSKLSPTARSLAYLREQGWLAQVVERRVPGQPITIDLYGFIDIIAIRGRETLAVQTTSRDNIAARCTKIAENLNVGRVREAGWAIHVHGWGPVGKPKRVELKIVDVS